MLGPAPKKDQQANEDACRIFGHLPQASSKPETFAQIGQGSSEQEMRCKRCGKVMPYE